MTYPIALFILSTLLVVVFALWRIALRGYRQLLRKHRLLMQAYEALSQRVYQQQIKEIDD